MEIPRGGFLSLMLDGKGGESSVGTQGRDSQGGTIPKREWKDNTLKYFLEILEEKYWEYNRKAFKKSNWESFVRQLNMQFPNEAQRSWTQVRDKWNKMRAVYQDEKIKQEETGAPPSSWTPWYEIIDNMLGGTAKINGVPHGVDQGVFMQHEESQVLSDVDEDPSLPTPPPPPSSTQTGSSQSPRTAAVNQLGCEGQVNRNAGKRKRKLAYAEDSIASAITTFSKDIVGIEKMKLELTERLIENEKESRKAVLEGQLQMAALFVEVLKNKDAANTSK